MKRLIIILNFCLMHAAGASTYWPQGTHIRNLVFETWSGSYIESTYVAALGTVRFDFCARESRSMFKKCERLHRPQVLIRDLAFYQPYLLTELKELRHALAAELDAGFFSRLLGGSEADSSVAALDQMIREIEKETLKYWLLNTNVPRPLPRVASLRQSTRIAEAFRQVFELEAPKPLPALQPDVLTGSGI